MSNPYIGPRVKCSQCGPRKIWTRNANGVCGRHKEGRENLGKAITWQRENGNPRIGQV